MNPRDIISTETATSYLTQDMYETDEVPYANSPDSSIRVGWFFKLAFYIVMFMVFMIVYQVVIGGY